jgi:hypothetical protein
MPNDLRVRERHTRCPGSENRWRPGKTRYRYFLGVKWSQVQILSARPEKHEVKAVSETFRTAFLCPTPNGGKLIRARSLLRRRGWRSGWRTQGGKVPALGPKSHGAKMGAKPAKHVLRTAQFCGAEPRFNK